MGNRLQSFVTLCKDVEPFVHSPNSHSSTISQPIHQYRSQNSHPHRRVYLPMRKNNTEVPSSIVRAEDAAPLPIELKKTLSQHILDPEFTDLQFSTKAIS